MAWTSVADFGTQPKSATGAVVRMSPTVTLTADSATVAILTVCKDNTAASSGFTNEVTSVTDSQGNWWQKLGERTAATAASAGATVAVFATILKSTLTTGVDFISANFATSVNASVLTGWKYTITNGNRLSVIAYTSEAATAATYGSLAITGLANVEYLFFRGIALEGKTFNLTPTTNFTALSTDFVDAGGTSSSMSAHGEFRILTGTNATSAPDSGMGPTNAASLYLAIQEGPANVSLATGGCGR